MKKNPLKILLGKKGGEICQKIISQSQRFPDFFPTPLLKTLKYFILSCHETYLELRSKETLRRILFTHQRLIENIHKEPNQKIHVKILEIDSSVYGIAIALESLKEDEIFGEKQILKGIQNLIPGIKPIPTSFHTFEAHNTHLFYLEIKKMRRGHLSKEKLNAQLHVELLQRIESLSYALVLPGNEEETFKNIRHLSEEITSIYDLPQVMITLAEYVPGTLQFLVIVLRVVTSNTPSLISLSSRLPPTLHFSLENTLKADQLNKNFDKEASVFNLVINSQLFLRDNSTINLRAARHYVSKALENMLGPFRDYNGGLLMKENEQLLAIKRELDKKGIAFTLLEDLFFGIKPISMRLLTNIETGIELALLFQQIEEKSVDQNQQYCFVYHQTKEVDIAIIKTTEKGWKNTLPQTVFSHSPEICCSSIEHEGDLYLFFFHQFPTVSILVEAIRSSLNQMLLSLQKEKSILHINFQGGDPPSLNPHLATDIHCHTLCSFLFEGLTRLSCSGKVTLAAAERIEISASETTYTFHLHRSYWSNGEEVTAYDFERAWKKSLMASWISYDFFAPIKNAIEAREKRLPINQVGIVAKNEKTLCVELNAPCPYFLNLIATPQFYPLLGEAQEPSYFNGPFTLNEWKRNESIYLSKNPFYWDAKNLKLRGVNISLVSDPITSYKMFQKGNLDVIGDPSTPLTPVILKSPKIQHRLIYKTVSRIFWIHCNTHVWPLHNKHLRQALSFALNRKRITDKVFIKQIPHCSPFPPKYATYEGNVEGDPELAKKYFEKALDELNLSRKELPPLEIIHCDLSFEKPLIKELTAQWKETLGITIQPKLLCQWSEFASSLEKGEFQLGGLFRRDLYDDVSFYLSFFADFPSNSHRLKNEKYQILFNRYYREGYSKEILREIELLLIEEAPIIPLISQRYIAMVNPKIKSLAWTNHGCLDIKEVSFHENYTHSIHANPDHYGVSKERELSLSK